ncbi:hypothetical protein Bhyg_12505, partial [Pseudolycoriella hygida]
GHNTAPTSISCDSWHPLWGPIQRWVSTATSRMKRHHETSTPCTTTIAMMTSRPINQRYQVTDIFQSEAFDLNKKEMHEQLVEPFIFIFTHI